MGKYFEEPSDEYVLLSHIKHSEAPCDEYVPPLHL